MAWNKITNLAALSLAFIFAACGDDSGNNVSSQKDSEDLSKREVSSFYELGVCDETNALTSVFVATENTFYFCDGTSWQKTYFELSSSSNQTSQIENPSYQQSSLLEKYSSSSFIEDSCSRVGLSSEKAEPSSSTTTKSSSSKSLNLGTFVDARDGKTYKTVVIGTQTWMAENLSYRIENSFCYENNVDNCNKYGRLYTLDSAIYVCPNGWHLPTMTEWQTLSSLDGASVAGKNLKTTTGWNKNGGVDIYGFSALPAGHGLISTKGSMGYGGIGSQANFWLVPEMEDYFLELKGDDDRVYKTYVADADGVIYIRSVRCLKGKNTYKPVSSSSAKSSSSQKIVSSSSVGSQLVDGILTDFRDGQTYKTVKIAKNEWNAPTQTWMAQNLNYKSENSYCYGDDSSNCNKYGRLYTWAAAVGKSESECGYGHTCSLPSGNIQGVCPSGWHLPSRAEWEVLFNAVGESIAGKSLKSTSGWVNDGNGKNYYGFSVLPAGSLNSMPGLGVAYFWSSTEYKYATEYTSVGGSAYIVIFAHNNDGVEWFKTSKDEGHSVRCLLD